MQANLKSIEQIYQKKTPLEHILLRPDTYIGTIQRTKQPKWVLPKNSLSFVYKDITYTPGFYKIFDQVLVNAADNYQRDKKMNTLKVEIDQDRGFISVYNNGKGIPVAIHKQHRIYVPELIFGHLLTGSNYNDDQRRIVGGRNGYGAKLANVFSNKFIVECGDSQNRKKFKMTWSKNMSMHSQPQIQPYSGKDFVKVTFYPCFNKFNMQDGLDDQIVSLLTKRVYDMAGIMPRVKVFLNEKPVQVDSFNNYVDLYFQKDSGPTKIRDSKVDTDRWQVIVSISEGEFRQVSFVNSVCTSKGGTHVNYIIDQIVDKIQEKIKKKQKNLTVKPFQIKAHLWIFVNCLIQNPTFDTQTKETLTLKPSQFGSACQLSQQMIKQILKVGIVDAVINMAKAKQLTKLAKATAGTKKSKLTGIPKLQDANEAGTKNSERCTLILTEGDSAKSLAMAGLAVVGRDYYGVFPLKGKLLNVREANNKTLMANEQIQNLLKIVGLNIGKSYQDLKSLRYGAIMIMSDQDTDGSHIKGLVVNFIHFFWPSLFKIDGFLKQFITPLLKVSKGTQSISFYTMRDFKVWAQEIENLKTWTIKYYKGLGTSTDKQARQYFQNLLKHKIDFKYMDAQDDDALQLVFSKKKIQERKNWLSVYNPEEVMVYDRPKIRYKEFIDRQFIHFSNEDNIRSIGSVIDGFKPGQRKIIYSCFKRNLVKQIKVAQLAGYVSQNSAYHHGEQSLVETIVGMAQNFVGSNNINLLMPNGQFGSRNLGGKDHASARYIFTNLSKVTRFIFPEADDHTLTYIEDDGQWVEPTFYMPIIPMIMVNGCQGIGTGWSTFIPNYNPRQLVEIIKARLNGEQFPEIMPWYKNYHGEMTRGSDFNIYTKGILQVDQSKQNTIIIKELPISKWTKDYKIFLDQIMSQGQTKIVGLREYHTKDKVHFQVQLNQEFFEKMYNGSQDLQKLENFFKISASISLKNIVAFNQQSRLQKYSSGKAIMEIFFKLRQEYYERRKKYLLSRLDRQLSILQMKARFIIEVTEQKLVFRNVKRDKLCQILKEKGYKKFSQFPKVLSTKPAFNEKKKQDNDAAESASEEQEGDQRKVAAKQYNYLLSMPLWSLTYEKVQEIKGQSKSKQNQYRQLQKTSIKDMWITELNSFLQMLEKVELEQISQRKKEDEQMKKQMGKGKQQHAAKKRAKKQSPKKKKQINWDSDSSAASEKTGFSKDKTKNTFTEKAKKQPKKQQPKQSKEQKKNKKQQPIPQSDDFFSRVKRKMTQESSTVLMTQPVDKAKNLNNVLKPDTQYQVIRVPNPKLQTNQKTQKKKSTKERSHKKMSVDSDESEDLSEFSEYSD